MTRNRILIADDHGVVRAGLRSLLNTQPDIEVCGEAANGQEAIDRTAETNPDVVLLDLKMPDLDGFEALRRIKAQNPGTKVLILSMYDDQGYLRKALQSGASGYVLKQAADVELLAAIRAVHSGKVYLDSSLSGIVVEGFLAAKAPNPKAEEPSLSERELQVLRLLAYGYTNQQIADQLSLSVKTVESYKARITDKLDLRGRAALTRYALQKGLLTGEP